MYATVVATPDASFNVATSQCDICEALGEKKTTTVVEHYTNGVKDTEDVTYTATTAPRLWSALRASRSNSTNADGDYRLVVIDTYARSRSTEVFTEEDRR